MFDVVVDANFVGPQPPLSNVRPTGGTPLDETHLVVLSGFARPQPMATSSDSPNALNSENY